MPKDGDLGPLWWETFFSRQRHPVLRSQLLTSLMAGNRLEMERLPNSVLLDAVLLSMATRNYLQSEIVDDYDALLRRTDTVWREPSWTCKTFDHVHMGAADFIVRGANELCCTEEKYVPDMAAWYLSRDVPNYFKREIL